MTPITYLWIALGGALGSVGRAWIAVVATRITGPQFPWGTILINVVGSFVIGFFGTLTTSSEGRFAVPADARAFVMIGICGGFTTFSSFSLQTLDLARDGRPWRALANIALSVILCLCSVAAGHYSAASLNQGKVVQGTAYGHPDLPGSVLAVVDRPDATDKVLAAVDRLLTDRQGGQIHVLAIRPNPAAPFLPSEEVITRERAREDAARAAGHIATVRTAFDAWARLARANGRQVDWTEIEGAPGNLVAERARNAAVAVVRCPDPEDDELAHEAFHAGLFDARCPMLVVPRVPGAPSDFGRVIAVAWKEDERAAGAVTAALPWLRRADRVVVLRGSEGDQPGMRSVPAALARERINSQVIQVQADARDMGAALLQAAHHAGADLLVMGAYGRGELWERILGGVTRFMLTCSDLPILMRH